MVRGNHRRNYHSSPAMHPSLKVRGWKRLFWCALNDEEWEKFREYAARDCLPMGVIFARAAREYIRVCEEHYRKMNEAEDAAVGGEKC